MINPSNIAGRIVFHRLEGALVMLSNHMMKHDRFLKPI
jgi:hypothetical protein